MQENKYVPRAICVDLEPNILDNMVANPMRQAYKPDNLGTLFLGLFLFAFFFFFLFAVFFSLEKVAILRKI